MIAGKEIAFDPFLGNAKCFQYLVQGFDHRFGTGNIKHWLIMQILSGLPSQKPLRCKNEGEDVAGFPFGCAKCQFHDKYYIADIGA